MKWLTSNLGTTNTLCCSGLIQYICCTTIQCHMNTHHAYILEWLIFGYDHILIHTSLLGTHPLGEGCFLVLRFLCNELYCMTALALAFLFQILAFIYKAISSLTIVFSMIPFYKRAVRWRGGGKTLFTFRPFPSLLQIL